MKLCDGLVAALLLTPSAGGVLAQNKAQGAEPVVWGATSGNTSCVIFAEGHKTSGRFYGVAITTKTVGKLTVVASENYTMPQSEIPETQEAMNNLMQIAQRDHVKFVKIPEKYSPELLEKARSSCKAVAQ